jgi:formylglycine-generating enzyme required for sulfatase activity
MSAKDRAHGGLRFWRKVDEAADWVWVRLKPVDGWVKRRIMADSKRHRAFLVMPMVFALLGLGFWAVLDLWLLPGSGSTFFAWEFAGNGDAAVHFLEEHFRTLEPWAGPDRIGILRYAVAWPHSAKMLVIGALVVSVGFLGLSALRQSLARLALRRPASRHRETPAPEPSPASRLLWLLTLLGQLTLVVIGASFVIQSFHFWGAAPIEISRSFLAHTLLPPLTTLASVVGWVAGICGVLHHFLLGLAEFRGPPSRSLSRVSRLFSMAQLRLSAPFSRLRAAGAPPARRRDILLSITGGLALSGLIWWVAQSWSPTAALVLLLTAFLSLVPLALTTRPVRVFENRPTPPRLHVSSIVDLKLIPAGSFMMGSPEGEEGRDSDEGPQHRVHLSSFQMASTPVTEAQWNRVMVASRKEAGDATERPKVGVSWLEAVRFCNALSRHEKLDPAYDEDEADSPSLNASSNGYRLPTEAQWEYACRACTTTRFWSGDSEDDLARVGWYASNNGTSPEPVASKPANPFGLYDMHGNAWESCQDWFGSYGADEEHNPAGPRDGSARVMRGGSSGDDARGCRSADRDRGDPGYGYDDVGFRVVLPFPPEPDRP